MYPTSAPPSPLEVDGLAEVKNGTGSGQLGPALGKTYAIAPLTAIIPKRLTHYQAKEASLLVTLFSLPNLLSI